VLNQNLNKKIIKWIWFEFLDIHINGKKKTCHDCHGFKWQNINIYPILTIFLCDLTTFLAHWIVIAPSNVLSFSKKITLQIYKEECDVNYREEKVNNFKDEGER
jgi:hypothetical protein